MSRLESNRNDVREKEQIKQSESKASWSMLEKEQAIQAFEEADRPQAKPLPPDLKELFDNAKVLMNSGEFQLAKRVFLTVLQKEPNFDDAYDYLTDCLYQLGEFDSAQNYLKIRTEIHPSFKSYFAYADDFYHRGEIDAAEKNYQLALKYPHIEGAALFEIYKNLGNIGMQKRDLSFAEENYSRAYTLNDKSDVLLVNFGSLAIHRGQLDRAVSCLREAVQLNPKNAKAWIGLGMVHREFGDYELSWANLEKALDYDPANGTAAKLVSEWGMKDNEIERAIRLLTQYSMHKPNDAFNEMMLAKYYYLIGRLKMAKRHIDQAYDVDPKLADIESLRDIINEDCRRAGKA